MTDEPKPAAEDDPETIGADADPARRKLDPESLVLRGQPGKVDRFKRGAFVAGAAAASIAVVGTAWVALKPGVGHMTVATDSRSDLSTKPPTEVISGLPASYEQVPKLGAPLPGDLGRAILEQQAATGSVPVAPVPSAEEQAAATERQRLIAAQVSARQSAVMMTTQCGERSGQAAQVGATSADAANPPASATSAAVGSDDGNGQAEKRNFAGGAANAGTVNPHVIQAAASRYVLSAGSIIAASLITGINSDLPGLVTAQVTQNAYDSPTGRTVLIPQGTRLIGTYDSAVSYGQKRALLVWQRIIFPDGTSLEIDNVPGSDTQGYAGLTDRIDGHGWQLIKGVVFSTLLGVGTQLGLGGDDDLTRAIRESTQQNVAHAGDQLVSKTLNVQPTIKVRPGWPLRIVVQKDLVLQPWRGGNG